MKLRFHRIRIIFPGALILLSGLLAACAQAASTPAPSALTDLHDIQPLQAAFNQDEGKPRLILLGAPT
jgi:hypothetical protein